MYCRSSCGELFGGHFAPVGRERAVHFAADGEQGFFVGVGAERRGEFFLEDRQAALEVFQVEGGGPIDRRECFVEAFGGFFETRGDRGVRAAIFLRGGSEARGVAFEIAFQFRARKWFRRRALRGDSGPEPAAASWASAAASRTASTQ